MGWWNTAVLGGDPPLDVLARVEDILGIDELYPLDLIADPGTVAAALENYGLARLASDACYDGDDPGLAPQVIGTLAMAVGADLGTFAEDVKAAADADQWAQENPERRARMNELIATATTYDRTRTAIDNPGLFNAFT